MDIHVLRFSVEINFNGAYSVKKSIGFYPKKNFDQRFFNGILSCVKIQNLISKIKEEFLCFVPYKHLIYTSLSNLEQFVIQKYFFKS